MNVSYLNLNMNVQVMGNILFHCYIRLWFLAANIETIHASNYLSLRIYYNVAASKKTLKMNFEDARWYGNVPKFGVYILRWMFRSFGPLFPSHVKIMSFRIAYYSIYRVMRLKVTRNTKFAKILAHGGQYLNNNK